MVAVDPIRYGHLGRDDPRCWSGPLTLRPITICEEMIRRHPERDLGSARRTLRAPRAALEGPFGPQQEVIFRQEHGRACRTSSTPTLGVTIAGKPLDAPHLPLHPGLFRLGTCRGGNGRRDHGPGQRLAERALVLGGTPREHRTDSLSAAFANLDKAACDDLRERYDVCRHYGMEPSRFNVPGPREPIDEPLVVSRPSLGRAYSSARIDGLPGRDANRRYGQGGCSAPHAHRCVDFETLSQSCPGNRCDMGLSGTCIVRPG